MRDAVTEIMPTATTSYEVSDSVLTDHYYSASDGFKDPHDRTPKWVDPYDMDPALILDGFFGSDETTQEEIDEDNDYNLLPWVASKHDFARAEEEYRLADRYEEHLKGPACDYVDKMTPDWDEEMLEFGTRWAQARYAKQFPELFSDPEFLSLNGKSFSPDRVPNRTHDQGFSEPMYDDLSGDEWEHLPLRGKCLDNDRELPGYEQEYRTGWARQPHCKGRKHKRHQDQRHIRRGRHLKQPYIQEVSEEARQNILATLPVNETFFDDVIDYYVELEWAYMVGEFHRSPSDLQSQYVEYYSDTSDPVYHGHFYDDHYLDDWHELFWFGEEEEPEEEREEELIDYLWDDWELSMSDSYDEEELGEEATNEYDFHLLPAGGSVGKKVQMSARPRF